MRSKTIIHPFYFKSFSRAKKEKKFFKIKCFNRSHFIYNIIFQGRAGQEGERDREVVFTH